MNDFYSLYNNAPNAYPKQTVVDCSQCGAQIGNDFDRLNQHLKWHQFVALIGESVNVRLTS